ncbi:hydroxylysine kinase-like [Tubulanus polymorphus]|uniref:hydroxylysine kinase-like n=1 Tax=Tubulanus polymorphus TaxID=672921 RepID=UPI003DA6CCDB
MLSRSIPISGETAANLVQKLYGLHAIDVKILNGFRDANFYIKSKNGDEFVLKIMNTAQTKAPNQTVALIQMLQYLNEQDGIAVPKPVRTTNGTFHDIKEITYDNQISNTGESITAASTTSGSHLVRLQSFLPGTVFHDIPGENVPSGFYYQLGESIANLQKSLMECPVRLPEVPLEADEGNLMNLPKLRDLLQFVNDAEHRQVLSNIVTEFEEIVLTNLHNLRASVIHGDINTENVVVSGLNSDRGIHLAFIDFDEANEAYLVFDLAIALAYFTCFNKGRDMFEICREILRGYTSNFYIADAEKRVLKTCICARFAQSMLLGWSIYARDPAKTYALDVYRNGWSVLEKFRQVTDLWNKVFTGTTAIDQSTL